VSLLAFAIGIEFAQLLLALLVLVLNVLVIHLFKSSRRDWLMVGSSIIIGILLPILIDRLP
jgi:Na+-translocating ferredoxin:NAD+ oxidoreductase RnfD subunit